MWEEVGGGVLGGEGLVVHEEEVDIAGVVDDESLVAAGHQVAGLLVGSVTDLRNPSAKVPKHTTAPRWDNSRNCESPCFRGAHRSGRSYLGHSSLALEPPSDAVVDTLRLPP